ncbi:MAG: FAD-dependent oxidoreductase [Bacteroidia bacterium]|nr:FAD-dependent oxidoreductase [Bacteroidia bacterium]
MQQHIVIIGNGISGITCARNIRKLSDHRITVISAETKHFFSRTALMYVYMGHMRFEDIKPYEDGFWEKNRIELMHQHVIGVDPIAKTVLLANSSRLTFDKLVIASGSVSARFDWPGQNLKGVQSLYSFQDLELMNENTKDIKQAVIVGGGLIGIEMAEMLHSRQIGVTMLVREKKFWDTVLPTQEASMIGDHIREYKIDLRQEEELLEINGDENGKVKSVTTKNGEEIACQFVGLTVGVKPNIAFLRESGIETDKGVLVNEFLQTNVQDVFAIGDCAQFKTLLKGRKAIEQVWYTGRMQAETLANTLCKQPVTYNPGNWFNSAKFFDIEYQTYGIVLNKALENEEVFYWKHNSNKRSLRIVFMNDTKVVTGFNVFGMRLRHEICDKWLNEKSTVDQVIANLQEAVFDPEFYKSYYKEIAHAYHSKLITT